MAVRCRWPRAWLGLCALWAIAGSTACGSTGSYIWVDALPAQAVEQAPYRIQSGDRLSVQVWNQPKLSMEVRVRPDGKVTLPLIGDVAAGGDLPPAIAARVEARLAGLVMDPKVTVSLLRLRPTEVSVLGEVRRPGLFEIDEGEGVLQALAHAGGLTAFARSSRIFVLRQTDERQRIRFRYADLVRGHGAAAAFALRHGDTVVVE